MRIGNLRSKTFVSNMTREVEHFARKMPVCTSSNRFGNFLEFGCRSLDITVMSDMMQLASAASTLQVHDDL